LFDSVRIEKLGLGKGPDANGDLLAHRSILRIGFPFPLQLAPYGIEYLLKVGDLL